MAVISEDPWREEDRWMRKVVSPLFGEPAAAASFDWLHDIFLSRGPVKDEELRPLALEAWEKAEAAAARRVAADVARTTGQSVDVTPVVDVDGFTVEVACDGEFNEWGGTMDGIGVTLDEEFAAYQAADAVQAILMERWMRTWPLCAEHGAGLHPKFIDDKGVWLCRRGMHYAPVGELALHPGSP